jgi:hypothetical protein
MQAKLPVNELFDQILVLCRRVNGFVPTDAEVDLMRRGFAGCFNEAQTKTRARPLSWTGYVDKGAIDEAARERCLKATFCKLLHYHMGKSSSYLGTIINATMQLEMLAESFALVPYPDAPDYWKFQESDNLYRIAKDQQQANREVARRFADHCDTFCQVLVFNQSKGKTSSVAGDQWRKAILGT